MMNGESLGDYSMATLRFRVLPEEHEPNGHGVQGDKCSIVKE
jgi:hypothetical protein